MITESAYAKCKVRTLPFTNTHSILQAFRQIFLESSPLLLFLAISFWPFFFCYRLVRARFECIIIFTRITCFVNAIYRLDFDAFKFVLAAFFSGLLTFRVRYVFCHGIYLFGHGGNFFLPTGESDDFLSAANGLY